MAYPFISFIPTAIKNPTLVFLAPAEAFWMQLKVSFVAALMLALPVILHQLWKFVAPGLFPQERRYVAPFVVVASCLFLAGASFCFFFVLPFAMGFLLTCKTGSMTPMLSVGNYVDFCLKFILSFGAMFELPVLTVFVTKMGLVTIEFLTKNRKYAVLIAFIVAGILTLGSLAEQWQREHENFTFVPVISDPRPADGWTGRTGLVHEAILQDFPDLSGHQVDACGSAAMVEAATPALRSQGLSQDDCFSDAFRLAPQAPLAAGSADLARLAGGPA